MEKFIHTLWVWIWVTRKQTLYHKQSIASKITLPMSYSSPRHRFTWSKGTADHWVLYISHQVGEFQLTNNSSSCCAVLQLFCSKTKEKMLHCAMSPPALHCFGFMYGFVTHVTCHSRHGQGMDFTTPLYLILFTYKHARAMLNKKQSWLIKKYTFIEMYNARLLQRSFIPEWPWRRKHSCQKQFALPAIYTAVFL